MPYEPSTQAQVQPQSRRRRQLKWREIIAMLPGRRRDYLLISLVIIDLFLLLFRNSYAGLVPQSLFTSILIFDFIVISIWGSELLWRFWKSENRLRFLQTYWYEFVGLIPLIMFRPFLLLRGVKLAILFYKVTQAEQDVSRALTREITFRFRDVIVDTIADAVFIRSLARVDELLARLDYVSLAQGIVEQHKEELRQAVRESIHNKSMFREVSRIPFMEGAAQRMRDEVGEVIVETLESEVMGEILKKITRGVVHDMEEHIRQLDLERITQHRNRKGG